MVPPLRRQKKSSKAKDNTVINKFKRAETVSVADFIDKAKLKELKTRIVKNQRLKKDEEVTKIRRQVRDAKFKAEKDWTRYVVSSRARFGLENVDDEEESIQVVDVMEEDISTPSNEATTMSVDEPSESQSKPDSKNGLFSSGTEEEEDWVYDLYYSDETDISLDLSSGNKRTAYLRVDFGQDLVYEDSSSDENGSYRDPDEDDENEEDNWRNDYPDEDDDLVREFEARFGVRGDDRSDSEDALEYEDEYGGGDDADQEWGDSYRVMREGVELSSDDETFSPYDDPYAPFAGAAVPKPKRDVYMQYAWDPADQEADQ